MVTLYTFGPMFGLPDPSPFVVKTMVQLKMLDIAFDTNTKGFAKAPKGKQPYIRDGDAVIPDSTQIRAHLEQTRQRDLDAALTAEQRATGWAIEKMLENHLYWAIVDARWMVDRNFDRGPRRFFDIAPAPLRGLIASKVRRDVKKNLYGQGFGRHTRREIEALAARDLTAVADLLGDKPFLFGDTPHGADATVYAFVASALCPHFDTPIRAAAERHGNILAFVDRGNARWFPEITAAQN